MILKPSPVPPVPREGSVYLDLPGLVSFEFGGYHVSIKSALDFLATWIFLPVPEFLAATFPRILSLTPRVWFWKV